ncbi:MAG: HlyC/CorC family transporter [Microthrixaceae bacterium]|nr:HlyC/CorC family transporter [Microthrixaceae bacterium]
MERVLMALVAISSVDIWLLVVVVLLVGFAAVLALAETAITRMTRARAAALVDQGVKGGERVLSIVENLERDLNAVYLSVNIVQTVQAALVGVLCANLFGSLGVVIGIALNVVVLFVVAEAAPKTWALQHTERAALLTAPLVQFCGRGLRLIAKGLIGVANVILPGKGLSAGPFVTEEEIIALAEEAAEAGGIEESERVLIQQIIRFGDTVAREIMVPRTDMVAMQAEHRVTDMVEVAIMNGLSRFPVYGEGVDDVVGVVFAKDLVRAERDGGADRPVRDLMRPAFFVPETKRVAELLAEMQQNHTHMAIIVDEYGGIAGLVTLEDLLEELVGEITDEFDTEAPEFEILSSGDILLNDPAMNVDDLNEAAGLALPEGDWDSVGGLVFSELGRVPEVGDRVCAGDAELVVMKMDGRRVGALKISRIDDKRASQADE